MRSNKPMKVSGHEILPPNDRDVLWKKLCMIGQEFIECLVEMSQTKTKFFIVVFDLLKEKFFYVQLFTAQAKKILRACDNSFEKVMKLLDFKINRLILKHMDVCMSFEKYMPKLAQQVENEYLSRKEQAKALN
jgi:hypothetical protein